MRETTAGDRSLTEIARRHHAEDTMDERARFTLRAPSRGASRCQEERPAGPTLRRAEASYATPCSLKAPVSRPASCVLVVGD